MPFNVLPIGYSANGQSHSHAYNPYSIDDVPKNVVMTLNQGSSVNSMDFHPSQQTILLGRFLLCSVFPVCLSGFRIFLSKYLIIFCSGNKKWGYTDLGDSNP